MFTNPTFSNFVTQFVKPITHNVCDMPRLQPTDSRCKILLPGPLVTYRAFRQCAPCFVRASTKDKYQNTVQQLKPELGTVISLWVARSA